MEKESNLVDNGDGTITDESSSLMWKKADSMIDLKKWVNYQDCVDYVRELRENKFAGYDDWRLPTREEMGALYDESFELKDRFGKTVHINPIFEEGCGFSIVAGQVPGRQRTWILNIRTGEFDNPDGLWTLTEATRAVRSVTK